MNFVDGLFYADIIINFFIVLDKEDGEFEDDRKVITLKYLKGWFIIDFAAVFPFDKVIQAIMANTSSGKYNSLIRVTRIGKLYKLVKVTRLIRVLKLFKSKGKLFRQLNSFF